MLSCHCGLQSFKGPQSLELLDTSEGSTGRKQQPISGLVASDWKTEMYATHVALLFLSCSCGVQSFKGPQSLEMLDTSEGSTGRKQQPISGLVAEEEDDEDSPPETSPGGAAL